MEKIEIRDKEYQAETVTDVIVEAWKDSEHRPTQAEIARAVGRHRQQVYFVLLRAHAIEPGTGGREYPELDNPKTWDGQTDEEIAQVLGVAASTVMASRLRLGIQKGHPVDVAKRRQFLVYKLFDNGYKPGPKFSEWLCHQAEDIFDDPAPIIDFYVLGKRDGGTRSNSRYRFIRWGQTNKLKLLWAKADLDELTKAEVLRA